MKPFITILKDHPFEEDQQEIIFGLENKDPYVGVSCIFPKNMKTNVFEIWDGIKRVPKEALSLPVFMQ